MCAACVQQGCLGRRGVEQRDERRTPVPGGAMGMPETWLYPWFQASTVLLTCQKNRGFARGCQRVCPSSSWCVQARRRRGREPRTYMPCHSSHHHIFNHAILLSRDNLAKLWRTRWHATAYVASGCSTPTAKVPLASTKKPLQARPCTIVC